MFFWTPPHFWALSLLIKDDYARASVPMLPLVANVRETKRQIFLHTLLLVAMTAMFFTTRAVGWIYLASAIGLGSGFIAFAWRLLRAPDDRHAASTYKYSLLYLALLFAAIAVDGAVGI